MTGRARLRNAGWPRPSLRSRRLARPLAGCAAAAAVVGAVAWGAAPAGAAAGGDAATRATAATTRTTTSTAKATPKSPATPTPPHIAAPAGVTCTAVEGFTRLSDGTLYRMRDTLTLTGVNSLSETGRVGTGWGGFAWAGAGGDGVVYALTKAGQLRWYRYDAAKRTWMPGSGAIVGVGFTPGSKVVNIAVGARGWLYTVRSDGRLVLYRHIGRLTGAPTWSNSGGYVLGSGWNKDDLIAPQGDGTLYRQAGGNLYWFRHSDPTTGPVTWAKAGRATKIGGGWRFYDLLALGSGVLLTTSAPDGQVSLYRHADPVGGAATWSVSGLSKYLARHDSYGVMLPAGTCS